MVALEHSRDPEKLKKVMAATYSVFTKYCNIPKEDKEELMMNIVYKFETADRDFALSNYVKLAKKEIWSYFSRKNAKKRMQQYVIDGEVVYVEELRLDMKVGEDEDGATLLDLVPKEDPNLSMMEYLEDVKKDYPNMYTLLQKAMNGEELKRHQMTKIRALLKHRYD